ncbi:acyl-CoA carboxylase subunit beta [Parvibaculum sp.]|uniref:acyl-CoA carboxylase subunit beta n=1 Tax=Parvibaculum sp. TaxID=2024848 RepID=UPI003C783269
MAESPIHQELHERRQHALRMGGEAKLAARRARGMLNARERIDALLDSGSFFEVGRLNHSDMPGMEGRTPSDGRVCGFGSIEGRTVAVKADDQTVLAGSGARVASKKSHAVAMTAIEKGYPFISLGEAGGARIPDIQGSDGLSSSGLKLDMALRDRRVPSVATVMGESFGSPGWYAAFSDFAVQTKGSCMAVVSPLVLEVATGEKVSSDELGSWQVQSRITGLIDRVAETEEDALALLRQFLSYMPSNSDELPPVREYEEEARARQIKLQAILPESSRTAYDMRKLLRTLVDHETIFELKPEFDRSVITCLARIDGHVVGIVANNPMFSAGAMGPKGCSKCTKFIVTCDSFHIPLIFLHDTPGFFVGKNAEHAGVAGQIINFYEALAHATVPKIAVVVRKSYGMAYYNMGGGNMNMDFRFAWPSADISFMAPELATEVTHGGKLRDAEDRAALKASLVSEMRSQSAPWRAAGLHYLDDVIDPSETRDVIKKALLLARGKNGGRSERKMASWPTSF